MILQTSIESQIGNLIHVVGRKYPEKIDNVKDSDSLKNLYCSYLEDVQKRKIEENDDGIIITNLDKVSRILDIFNGGSEELDDRYQKESIIKSSSGNIEEQKEKLQSVLETMSTKFPEYYELFKLIITNIFISPSHVSAGGSSSNTIGIIWTNVNLTRTIEDILELLIHEFSHNCLFIDEHRYRHYNYEVIFTKETWAKSAVLSTNRPIDKVLHSIVVSLEVMLFREKLIGHPSNPRLHPPTKIMLKQIYDSIESLQRVMADHPKAVMPRVDEIIENVKEKLKLLS